MRTLPMTLMVMLIAPVAGKLNGRIGPRPLMVGGMLLSRSGSLADAARDRLVLQTRSGRFHLLGAGISMTMPTTSGVAMGSVDPRARASPRAWSTPRARSAARSASPCSARSPRPSPPPLGRQRAGGPAGHRRTLDPLVIGGQAEQITRVAGPEASLAATHAFVDGVTTAMTVGAVIALVGAVVAFIGLRGFRPVAAPQAIPRRRRRGVS